MCLDDELTIPYIQGVLNFPYKNGGRDQHYLS